MPIYEYQCDNCHEIFEIFQSMHDAPLVECGKCRGKVQRLISRPAILFKGSGFHVTDYARSSKSGSSEPKPDASGAAKKETPKADASPKPPASSSDQAKGK